MTRRWRLPVPPAAWLPGTLLAVAAFLACLRVGDMAPWLPDELTVECVGGCSYRPLGADVWAAFLSAATVLPLLARDSRPGPAAHTSFLAAAGLYLLMPRTFPGLTACAALGFYTLARHRVHHPALLCGYGIGAMAVLNVLYVDLDRMPANVAPPDPDPLPLPSRHGLVVALPVGIVILTAIAVAGLVRAAERRARAREEEQARLLAAERDEAARTERAEIARELHDIVSHSVSVIAVRAESATYTTPELSPQAREGFQQIAMSSRESLSELRQMLNVLRSDGGGEGDGDGPGAAAPTPTLARLDELLARHRSAGATAELRVHGARTRLAASVELSAYRIVQEALTNARRHAPGAHAVVEIGYEPHRLTVRIADDGPGPPGDEGVREGHGLIGMRERVSLCGGRFAAGPGPGGGFLVHAALPTPPEETVPEETVPEERTP